MDGSITEQRCEPQRSDVRRRPDEEVGERHHGDIVGSTRSGAVPRREGHGDARDHTGRLPGDEGPGQR